MENNKFNIEENREYYKQTTEKINNIEEMITNLQNQSNSLSNDQKQNKINEIINKIKEERSNFYNLIDFLPNYDRTLYAKMYDELLEKVDKVKTKMFPKKKFAFSTKINKKNNPSSSNVTSKENDKKEDVQKEDENDLIIKNVSNSVINKRELEKNNVIIENVNQNEIYLLSNFKACYIKTAKNCKIYIGSVSGGTHITDCNECEIYIATHQLRIHQTVNTKFYVMINSNPIIEKSTNNIFYPLKISYNDYETNINKAKIDINNNKWNQVQDFQWLKKEKSPNFEAKNDNQLLQLNC